MSFSKLELDENIVKAVEEAGYTEPTEVQKKSIPVLLEGKDAKISAQTGSGKTAAFLLPALQKLASNPNRGGKGATILILTPTRELAQQITTQADKYSRYLKKIRSVCVVGGIPYHKQQAKLSRPYDILIATPGRLIDYLNRGKISFDQVDMVVLDEADRMLDMGFSESVEEILSQVPKQRQTLLFSATLKGDILKLSEKHMKEESERIIVHTTEEKHKDIEQNLLFTDGLLHKNDLLLHILNMKELTSAIIFTSTKRHCDELLDELDDQGFACDTLHGDIPQRARSRVIKALQNGRINILIATDVAARGIDINGITHVINFDLPRDIEDYVHRIGRTGRAGNKGVAFSFAGAKDVHLVPKIEEYTNQKINVIEFEGLEPKTKPKAPKKDGPKNRRNKMKKSSNSRSRKDPRDFKKRSNRSDRNSRSERSEVRSRGDRSERGERNGRKDRSERGERSDRRARGGREDRNKQGGKKRFGKSNSARPTAKKTQRRRSTR